MVTRCFFFFFFEWQTLTVCVCMCTFSTVLIDWQSYIVVRIFQSTDIRFISHAKARSYWEIRSAQRSDWTRSVYVWDHLLLAKTIVHYDMAVRTQTNILWKLLRPTDTTIERDTKYVSSVTSARCASFASVITRTNVAAVYGVPCNSYLCLMPRIFIIK